MKTVLFVPGFRETLSSRDYTKVLKAISAKGYKARFVSISWKRTEYSSWLGELNTEYAKLDPAETILAGFSYGAMVAFGAAAERVPAELWLCSLSPYFAEDIDFLKLAWIYATGKERMTEFRRLSFAERAPKITCKTLLFMGEKEAKKFPSLERRVLAAHKQIKHSQLIRILDCGHDIAALEYIKALQQAI